MQMGQVIQGATANYERGGTQKDLYSREEVIDVPCPYCAGERRATLMIEHGAVGIVRCLDCDLMYTSPRLKAPEAVYWGDTARYEEEARLIFNRLAPHHRDVNYDEELRLIKAYKPTGRFLDVGCNMGFLLRKVSESGWNAVGVEPSASLARLARQAWQLEVHNCFLDDLPATEHHTFDVVALSDVFEHITSPLSFLNSVKQALKPDGIVYVKVPNARFSVFKQQVIALTGKLPAAGIWDSYEHVVHYTDETLRRMLEKAGLDVLEVTFGRPVQLPVWHELVGHYYLNTSPWYLDWKRHIGRAAFYYAAYPERVFRGGRIGAFAPNLIAVARLSGSSSARS